MDKLSLYELENRMKLPKAYREFYNSCDMNTPKNLIGTDLLNRTPDLKKMAVQLLKEISIPNFLDENDFVFMMHQGYIFWYFKADGNENPIVYGFLESDRKTKNHGHLKTFLGDLWK